jgi:putative lipoic acid-binding regulatory protein
MRTRPSSGGKYQCVSVLVTLQNRRQLDAVYAALRELEDLKYLL